MLDILPYCLCAVLFLEHPAEFEHAADVVVLIFVLQIIDPFMNLLIRFTGSLLAEFKSYKMGMQISLIYDATLLATDGLLFRSPVPDTTVQSIRIGQFPL